MTVISQPARWRFWVAMAAVFLVTLWLLNDILLPFVVGIVVAYFLDPVVARLQRLRMSRTWATTAVTIVAVLLTIGVAMAILPPLFAQLQALVVSLPDYTVKLAARVMPLVDPIRERLNLPPLSLQELLFLTPVVTFYLLRDWERLVDALDGALPRDHAATIRKLAHESNAAIAGYVRGQALVCITLGTIYAVGLSLVGLKFGLVIGLIAGAISFIPFVGTFVGAVMALGMALVQFPPDWMGVVKVAVVFVIGQMLEGNVLSPKLVGDRVGLHPVWIMFALLAGGALFGFVGVLIAVPMAAVVGVLVRHLIGRYRDSQYYRGADAA